MKTILVAENFQAPHQVIVNALARNGYQVLEAAGGAEALKLFDGRSIDLLITEVKKPHMNGVELVEAIRKKSLYHAIPVLVLATEPNDVKKEASTARITAWITKPFDLERFLRLVEKSLQ